MPLHPSVELVTCAWLATLPGVTSGMVASTLPKLADSDWTSTGFLTVTPAGGVPDVYVPTRASLVQVNSWAAKKNAQRPPWGQANELAEVVVAGCWDRGQHRDLTVKSGYNRARVFAVQATMDPQRIYSDESSYASYRVDVRIDWCEIP